jgi:hypothetical protein
MRKTAIFMMYSYLVADPKVWMMACLNGWTFGQSEPAGDQGPKAMICWRK